MHLYRQQTDWTCSIACIRTILSNFTIVPTEQYLVKKYKLKPHAYFSNDIKSLNILKNFDVIYGCDNKQVCFDDILLYLNKGYYVMLESNNHWFVLIACVGKSLFLYDPYLDKVIKHNKINFISNWRDYKTEVVHDFVAVKEVSKMFKISRNVYLHDGRILDLREEVIQSEDVNIPMVQPEIETEYSLEKDMFAAYPQSGIPYSDSGSWIGMYNNGTSEYS